jgi:hypothetical protein
MEAAAVFASALPLLGGRHRPTATPTALPPEAGPPEAGGAVEGAVARLWASQRRLCWGAAAAFASLCGCTVAVAWPPPLAWACAASVRAPPIASPPLLLHTPCPLLS